MFDFLRSESGAVTVDWVVMTAALTGLGLAVSSTLSNGLQNLSSDTRDHMTGVGTRTAFDRIFAREDFENGPGAWSAGEVLNAPGFGNVLAFSGNQRSGSMPIDVDPKYSYAKIEFDVIVGDSWDNEQGAISIGGEDVMIASHAWSGGAPEIQTFDGPEDMSVTLTRTTTDTGHNSGVWQSNSDYTYRVSVTSRNDGSDLTLGASTTLDTRATDEFFGIDNVVVTGTGAP